MKHNWEYKRLGDICESINGLWTGKTPPFVNIGVIRNTNFTKQCTLNSDDIFYTDVEAKAFAKRKLQKGDIIIEKSGGSEKQPVGRPILFDLDGDFSFSNFTATLRLKEVSITPTFLHKALTSLYFRGVTRKMQSRTTGLYNLNWKSFLNLQIPVPPMEVQEQIVAELDKINEVIEDSRELLRNLDALAQSLFYDYFGDPIENPKGWEVGKVAEFFDTGSGGTPSKTIPEYWDSNDVPWIGSNMCQNHILYKTDGKFISNLGLQNSSAKILNPNTLLIALVGATIGKVALLKTTTSTNQNIAFIKPNEGFNPLFLFYTLQGLYPLFLGIGDSKFKMANLSFIRNLPIILPPLSLQEQFAARIEQIEAQKRNVEETIATMQTLLDSRMDYWFN